MLKCRLSAHRSPQAQESPQLLHVWRIGGDDDPYTMSWRGIDNQTYYMVDTTQFVQLLNYSGCGNTVSGNHPVTKRLIIDSLKRCYPYPTVAGVGEGSWHRLLMHEV